MRSTPNDSSWLLIAALVLLVGAPFASAQDASTSSSEPKTLRELIDISLKWYQLYPDADAKEPAEVVTALRWANNARGSEDGITILFVHSGRPLAAACVFPWAGRLSHDFESLSREKIVGRRDGQVVWQPQTPGVTFADIPEAPAPAASRPLRLRQMKALAEKFQATLVGWKADSSDREELRLLSRPLYRYDPKGGSVSDGAVFAFVMGTDPEVLLLLEAIKEGDVAKWQYAFARRTSGELEGRFQDTVVWKGPRFPQQNDPRQPHFARATPFPPGLQLTAEESGKEKPGAEKSAKEKKEKTP